MRASLLHLFARGARLRSAPLQQPSPRTRRAVGAPAFPCINLSSICQYGQCSPPIHSIRLVPLPLLACLCKVGCSFQPSHVMSNSFGTIKIITGASATGATSWGAAGLCPESTQRLRSRILLARCSRSRMACRLAGTRKAELLLWAPLATPIPAGANRTT